MDYDTAMKEIREIISKSESSQVLQDVADYLYENFDKYNWIGIYFVRGSNLILGPWRGEQATEHTKIPIGMGVCGSVAESGETEIVPDVAKDTRYLACFVSTKSEIAVPIKKNEEIVGEIDVDSDIPNAFSDKDAVFLEKVSDMLGKHIH